MDNNLTPDQVMDRYACALEARAYVDAEVEDCRRIFTEMRRQGIIGDKLEHPAFTLTWQTRSRWVYSPAVKRLQQMEQYEGVATKKISGSWTAKPIKPKF